MKIITKDTEKTLFNDLKNHWQSLSDYRCLYLRYSSIEDKEEGWFQALLNRFATLTDDELFKVYLCHDKDVFVLARTITQKRLDSFLLPTPLGPTSLKGLASLFEIKVDWPRLKELSIKKVKQFEDSQKQKLSKENKSLKTVNIEQLIATLDQGLISSLSTRREQRAQPEIMVVDDDLFSQKLVKNTLQKKYSLTMVSDGQGALMNYINKAPDVLFLDIGLPDINGHDVLAKIFELDPEAYIVMFSGNGDKQNIMKAIDIGAKGFVGKPFTQDKLFQYIEKSPFIIAKKQI